MNELINKYLKFINEIFSGELKGIHKILNEQKIYILDDFINNTDIITKFYEKYISPHNPKIVICGINPGRLGAGKTGIPFLDFSSADKLIDGIDRNDSEKSAQFFF